MVCNKAFKTTTATLMSPPPQAHKTSKNLSPFSKESASEDERQPVSPHPPKDNNDNAENTDPIPSDSPKPEPSPQDNDFDSYYLKQVAAEFADDLDKVRSAGDFSDRSVSILIEALRQGGSVYSEEEKKKVMEGRGDIPSFKLFESERVLAFLDIQPLSKGHALVIPKFHGAKLADIPDEHLAEILPIAKKLVAATGADDYNILQNNGRIAHQEVDHVHFHMIPKPREEEGLIVGWPQQEINMDKLKILFNEMKAKM
ncbi:Adenosine 5'-monophosphoramidase [Varicellaria rhodocarpa]|nr:Adenosine 5'-monophosphoramidase [Varicellaria rhodocarpa]